jgi:cell wall-associated NlpC family hydrolase
MMSREAVVSEARTWPGTPYRMGNPVKGAGCDCATLLFAIWRACDVIPDEAIGVFHGDWYKHVTEEIYMRRVLRHAHKIAEGLCYRTLAPLPGNIILVRTSDSKVFNHGAIVTKWPLIVHALPSCPVREEDATRHFLWAQNPTVIFDPWVKADAIEREAFCGAA